MRDHVDKGLREREIELLEAVADAVGADVDSRDQCEKCGQWYKQLSSHRPHCEGP